MPSLKVVEEEVPFGESLLWKLQGQAYGSFGPDAWISKGVPSYLTCHPLTARGYAEVVRGFVKDTNLKEVAITELGGGTGKFAYLFLKELGLDVRYTITDITDANLEFIRKHSLANRDLRFLRYHHDDTTWKGKFPQIVIANYYFDTLPQDLYRVENGKIYKGYITLKVPSEHHTGDAAMIPHLEASYSYKECNPPPLVDAYAAILKEGSFLFPSGGLKTIDLLMNQGPMLWLMADQGVTTLTQARNFREPKIARHGTFSVPVSYHFLHWYFQEVVGGQVLTMEAPDTTYTVMAAVLHTPTCQNTAYAFRHTLSNLEPIDYYRISEAMPNPSLEAIISLIKSGNYDPINFYLFHDLITSHLANATPDTIERLRYTARQTLVNFYPISPEEEKLIPLFKSLS